MTWTRLSDTFNDDPDLLEVSRSARLLHVEGLVYCNKHLRNGDLPRGALRRITDAEDPDLDAKVLVEAGVWSETETGWMLPWDDQEDAEEVRARQGRRAEIQQAYRKRKAAHEAGDHSLCDPRYCRKGVSGNATGNATSHETPSRPVPSRPLGRDRGRTAGAAPQELRRSAPSDPARVLFDEAAADSPTPWDVTVRTGQWEGHATFNLQPPDSMGLGNYTDEQVALGNRWFAAIVANFHEACLADVTRLADTHTCTATDEAACHVDLECDPESEPYLEIYVPTSVGDAWRDHIERTLITAMSSTHREDA